MDRSQVNKSIKCSVRECRYHSANQEYCALDSIQVGTHEMNPTQQECTDCMSFERA